MQGKIVLPNISEPPPLLQHLFTDRTPEARDFRSNIRAYNLSLAFASLGVQENVLPEGRWLTDVGKNNFSLHTADGKFSVHPEATGMQFNFPHVCATGRACSVHLANAVYRGGNGLSL